MGYEAGLGTGGGRGRCGTDCHCVSAGCGMERAAHCCSTCRLCAGVSAEGLSCRPMARSCAASESRLASAASRLSSPLPPSREARGAGAGPAAAAGPTGRFCMLAATTAATVGAPGLMPLAAAGAAAGPPSEGKASARGGRAAGEEGQPQAHPPDRWPAHTDRAAAPPLQSLLSSREAHSSLRG